MKRLKLIQGGRGSGGSGPKRTSVELLCCRVCSGTTFVQSKVGVVTRDGENIEGGTDQLICAYCLSQGRIEPII